MISYGMSDMYFGVSVPSGRVIALLRSEDGYSVSVPELPGCVSQGETEEEALANIEDAIREYLQVAEELRRLR
jgi:predicted RNase H-like HicB family nuclease